MTEYHRGELEVQVRAGVQNDGTRMLKAVRATLPPIARAFLSEQRMIVAGTTVVDGYVWASVLTGEPGFLRTVDEQTLEIRAVPHPGDPLFSNLGVGETAIGLIAIDFSTRRRVRINGRAQNQDGSILVHLEQVYSNCSQYIQTRSLLLPDATSDGRQNAESPGSQAIYSTELSAGQWSLIEKADTFFIASSHSVGGNDASHRGGLPGFISIKNATKLVFPDYAGNKMFQTLGNISADSHAGLLFLDFEHGGTLQLSGEARIIWDQEQVAAFVGAERLVEFVIDRVIETPGAYPLRWHLMHYSSSFPVGEGSGTR